LLKYLKISLQEKNDFAERSKILDTDQKIILLDHQNNFVGTLTVMSNAAKNFDILATSLSFNIIILIVQQNYFFYLYPAKTLDLSAKSFFRCMLDHRSNYVKRLNVDDKAAKNFNILAINLNVLNNYFDGSNEIIFYTERTILLRNLKFCWIQI